VKEHNPNFTKTDRLSELIAVRRETTTRNGHTFEAVYFEHRDFDGLVHAARRYVKVDAEGDPEDFWGSAPSPRVSRESSPSSVPEDVDDVGDLPPVGGNLSEDIANFRNQGFNVDDDREPAPENIPTEPEPVQQGTGLKQGQRWGWDGIDRRAIVTPEKEGHSFKQQFSLHTSTYSEVFLHFLPLTFFYDVIMSNTNDAIVALGEAELTWGEFVRFLGILSLMSTVSGFKRDDFWCVDRTFDQRENHCPYRFNPYMSKRRFNLIMRELRLTGSLPPRFADKFWQVRELIKSFNSHMASIFVSSWAICLDESMSIWFNRWTCPGWVYCPRKPHPFGNEYHTACCAQSGIMFAVEMVEGKDRPRELGAQEFSSHGKTAGLMLRMLKSYFGAGKYVILDSGFCVLKAIIELKKRGIYSSALIKKRRFWPTGVPGEAMDTHMESKDIGDVDAVQGSLDGVTYNLWAMKEPDYTMKMMATSGSLMADDSCRTTSRRWVENGTEKTKEFSYTLPFDHHFRYRHAVDDHNNLRHSLPSWEDTWVTQRWELRVLAFVIAVCEVNAYLAIRFTEGKTSMPTLLNFRRKYGWQLIMNDDLVEDTVEHYQLTLEGAHTLCRAPPHARVFRNRHWICDAMQRYQQYACGGCRCSNRIRTYCACRPGVWLCGTCHVRHVLDEQERGN
jgi:hypothetical protein